MKKIIAAALALILALSLCACGETLDWDSMKGHGYGNFMRVLTSPVEAGFNAGAGEYGWDGWMGCYFSVDPDEDLAFLFFIQQTNTGCTDFTRKLQSIVRSCL